MNRAGTPKRAIGVRRIFRLIRFFFVKDMVILALLKPIETNPTHGALRICPRFQQRSASVRWAKRSVPTVCTRLVIGERGLKEGNFEYQHRRDVAATAVNVNEIAALIKSKLAAAK